MQGNDGKFKLEHHDNIVIASASEAIHLRQITGYGLLRRFRSSQWRPAASYFPSAPAIPCQI